VSGEVFTKKFVNYDYQNEKSVASSSFTRTVQQRISGELEVFITVHKTLLYEYYDDKICKVVHICHS